MPCGCGEDCGPQPFRCGCQLTCALESSSPEEELDCIEEECDECSHLPADTGFAGDWVGASITPSTSSFGQFCYTEDCSNCIATCAGNLADDITACAGDFACIQGAYEDNVGCEVACVTAFDWQALKDLKELIATDHCCNAGEPLVGTAFDDCLQAAEVAYVDCAVDAIEAEYFTDCLGPCASALFGCRAVCEDFDDEDCLAACGVTAMQCQATCFGNWMLEDATCRNTRTTARAVCFNAELCRDDEILARKPYCHCSYYASLKQEDLTATAHRWDCEAAYQLCAAGCPTDPGFPSQEGGLGCNLLCQSARLECYAGLLQGRLLSRLGLCLVDFPYEQNKHARSICQVGAEAAFVGWVEQNAMLLEACLCNFQGDPDPETSCNEAYDECVALEYDACETALDTCLSGCDGLETEAEIWACVSLCVGVGEEDGTPGGGYIGCVQGESTTANNFCGVGHAQGRVESVCQEYLGENCHSCLNDATGNSDGLMGVLAAPSGYDLNDDLTFTVVCD